MKIVIATRIYSPEISAASGILRVWAEEFRDRGWEVTVLTTSPPRGFKIEDSEGIRVRRWKVKRDRQHYVRGYFSYLSFDIPLFFRLLFSRKTDLYVVEPPPTSVAVVRVVAALRRTPYVVRAADYWSEAAELVTSSKLILGTLRRLELWGLQGARILFAAHQPLIDRFRSAGVTAPAIPIGFGADTKDFRYREQAPPKAPIFVYAGTYSEWHGATIFVEAMRIVVDQNPEAQLLFYGNGEDRDAMRSRAHELGISQSVKFHGPIPPAELSDILGRATASVASLAPVAANEYAVATKVYSSFASGCPVIFTGIGPTVEFFDDSKNTNTGVFVEYDATKVAQAMNAIAASPLAPIKRRELAEYATRQYSLSNIAQQVVDASESIVKKEPNASR